MTPVFILVALFDVLNIELAALLEWLNANNLTLNVDKTFYMLFHRRHIKTDNLKLIIRQGTLKQTSQCKYLGLLIDNKLKIGQLMLLMLRVNFSNVLVF